MSSFSLFFPKSALPTDCLNSGFEYFAGGSLLKPTGTEGDPEDLYTLAEKSGYQVVKTQAEAVTEGPVVIVDEHLADGNSIPDELARTDDMWSLADAVQVAVDFAAQHPDETLIVVTGDHETGGMTIGFAGTDYDTYLDLLENQKISYAKFDSDYVASYKENKTPFENVLADTEKLFDMKSQEEEGDKLVLTEYELSQPKAAYEKSINDTSASEYEQEEYILYGTYEPLSVTLTHIINNKSGISFTSYSHTVLPVAVLAHGLIADVFHGYYDSMQVYQKLADMLVVQ